MADTPPVTPTPDRNCNVLPALALRPKDAARVLGIGERLLWSLTNQGIIPHIKLGKATLYPVDVLRDWLAEQAGKEARR